MRTGGGAAWLWWVRADPRDETPRGMLAAGHRFPSAGQGPGDSEAAADRHGAESHETTRTQAPRPSSNAGRRRRIIVITAKSFTGGCEGQ